MNYVLKIKAAVQGVLHRVFPTWMLWGLLLTVAACNADEGLPRQTGERAIGFAAAGVDTRALPTTSVKKIGVFGYSHSGNFSTIAASTLIPDYFLNKAVIDPTGTGNWSYTGVVKYWPDPDSGIALSFFAYAPYIDVEDTFTLYPSAINQTGSPTITYTVPADITSQIDLLWNNVLGQTYDAGTNNGTVPFTMEHALTRVDFSLKLNDAEQGRPYIVTINELTVDNVIGSGILNLSKTKKRYRPVGYRPVDNHPSGYGCRVGLLHPYPRLRRWIAGACFRRP